MGTLAPGVFRGPGLKAKWSTGTRLKGGFKAKWSTGTGFKTKLIVGTWFKGKWSTAGRLKGEMVHAHPAET